MTRDELNHAALLRLHNLTGDYKPAGTHPNGLPRYMGANRQHQTFDPANRNADAFILMVAFCMTVQVWESTGQVSVRVAGRVFWENFGSHYEDMEATARYAITRAAAGDAPRGSREK